MTVIILSLIGGLRSFDLIWAMTRGGPGLHIRCHRLGHLQAVPGRFLRPFDRRQRRPFRPGRRDHRSAVLFPEPKGGDRVRPVARYAISLDGDPRLGVVFIVPVRLHRAHRAQEQERGGLRDFSSPSTIHLWDNLVAVIKTRDYMLITAFMNSHHPDRRERRPARGFRRDGWLCSTAPAVDLDPL